MAKRTEAMATGSLNLKPPGAFVYRVYGWREELLYVGVTDDLCRRFAVHRSSSSWWRSAARVEWEEWPHRRAALEEEQRQIRGLRPIHNVIGNDSPIIPLPPVAEDQLPDDVRDRLFMERVRSMQAKRESL